MLDQEAAIVAHDRLNRWYLDPIAGRGYGERRCMRRAGIEKRCRTATSG
jgi:hypothetical protein